MNYILSKYKNWENNLISKTKEIINNNKKNFLIIFCIGILIHLFALTNKLLNWDEIGTIFGKGGSVRLGRWFLGMTSYIFPNYSMPVFNGVISLILLSIISCLICYILEIKQNSNKIIIGLILVSFPTITCTFSYMFTVHSYILSILLSVISVYFAKKDNKISIVMSVIALTLSLGIYQAYISVTATLLIILLIKEGINNNNLKKLIYSSLKYLLILIVSLVCYAIINKIILKVTNIDLSAYQGISTMGNYSLSGIINGIIRAYKSILFPIFYNNLIVSNSLSRFIYIVIILFCIITIGKKVIKSNSNKLNLLLSIFFIVLLPITINMLYILNSNCVVHALMRYAECFIFIFPIIIIDSEKNYLKNILKMLLLIQIFINIIFANEAYLKMYISYQNTYAFYEGLVTTIKNTEGFDENTKIVIAGNYDSKELNKMEQFDNLVEATGIASNSELINGWSKYLFIKYYIGFNGDFIYLEETNLKENSEFNNMPIYPYYGSIKKIDNIIVVKLSQ